MAGSELLDANNRSLSRAVDVQSKLSPHTHVTDGFISFDTATKELPTAICKWGMLNGQKTVGMIVDRILRVLTLKTQSVL